MIRNDSRVSFLGHTRDRRIVRSETHDLQSNFRQLSRRRANCSIFALDVQTYSQNGSGTLILNTTCLFLLFLVYTQERLSYSLSIGAIFRAISQGTPLKRIQRAACSNFTNNVTVCEPGRDYFKDKIQVTEKNLTEIVQLSVTLYVM